VDVTDYPVKIPPELFTEWISEALLQHDAKSGTIAAMVADRAAQWGADQELKACLWHLESTRCNQIVITTLRAARRPRPPGLAEQALRAIVSGFDPEGRSGQVVIEALERLAKFEAKQ